MQAWEKDKDKVNDLCDAKGYYEFFKGNSLI